MTCSKYLDPKNSLAFRKIFGQKAHKRIPIDFLNAVFGFKGEEAIVDVEFLNAYESTADLLVSHQNGTKYVIVIHLARTKAMERPAQPCASNLPGPMKVVFLTLTTYVTFPDITKCRSDHYFMDRETHEPSLTDLSFTFVELPKFNKKAEELESAEDQWYYFLKHAGEALEAVATKPGIAEAYEVLEQCRWTEQELQ